MDVNNKSRSHQQTKIQLNYHLFQPFFNRTNDEVTSPACEHREQIRLLFQVFISNRLTLQRQTEEF